MKISHLSSTRYGFSLIEILITFVLLGLMMSLLVPQYLKLQRQSTIQVAMQQADAVKKAVMVWSTSISDLNTLAGAGGYGATVNPTAATFTAVCGYLDSTTSGNIALINGNPVTYFQTKEMQNLTPNGTPTFTAVPATVFGAAAPAPAITTAAHAVVYWPTGIANRRATQPTVIFYYPN